MKEGILCLIKNRKWKWDHSIENYTVKWTKVLWNKICLESGTKQLKYHARIYSEVGTQKIIEAMENNNN